MVVLGVTLYDAGHADWSKEQHQCSVREKGRKQWRRNAIHGGGELYMVAEKEKTEQG